MVSNKCVGIWSPEDGDDGNDVVVEISRSDEFVTLVWTHNKKCVAITFDSDDLLRALKHELGLKV